METSHDQEKKMELRRGVLVFVVLAVLTVIEYFLGTHGAPGIFLWLIALLKAGLVIWFYMHIQRAFREEGGH
ncbi:MULTISPECIES: cytochrome C oxidase subunit IV family protein [Anaerolinea]|jgi:cytochrome c oxidase subunit 4|uniref:cytochrome C oxidase subunit IV family protein n=1 Tax=Anaerolinea TaxID=233189 RepID=UPI0026219EF8|nr:cytochrome C oxidase subunit IV family protein [Anaerolinea thermophila]